MRGAAEISLSPTRSTSGAILQLSDCHPAMPPVEVDRTVEAVQWQVHPLMTSAVG